MLKALVHYMNYLQSGLAVHTNNLENSVVPGSQASEMKPFKEQVSAKSSGSVERTNAMHLRPKSLAGAGEFATQKSTHVDGSGSKNAIDREQEIGHINTITTDYLQATRLYQKSLSILRNFLGVRT